ncbi:holin family protein [Jannaschia sp. KMU-145]|uniref:holin family protein n=1 Tax=Jannaschia halovivens TaxID=3388667 RepID=UPI00396AF926
MGLTSSIKGVAEIGRVAQGLTEVFVPNRTAAQALDHEAQRAALDQLEAEFGRSGRGGFDHAVDGLNRLPRPLLALGTLGLFVYAMSAPVGFAARMQGLSYVPDPLWWLLGAIVSFYFGAREMHYLRRTSARPRPAAVHSAWEAGPAPETEVDADNPALAEWRSGRS